jgi:tRNA(Ile2)-agmatinylcytidine synthase
MKVHIGIDDTDSKKGMCTTYLGAVLKKRIQPVGSVDELRLVRLNPNIPWKTRGNGAVALSVETEDYEKIRKITVNLVKELSELKEAETNPGIVFLKGEVNPELSAFYWKALRDLVTIDEAESLAKSISCEVYKFKNGRGIIGALAAILADLTTKTYELITYREPANWGRERNLDFKSVLDMDAATYPLTFNNIDCETKQILISPKSPCPVLFGIRGTNSKVLKEAKNLLKPNEPMSSQEIFKTNQGLDLHLTPMKISEARQFNSAILEGSVMGEPEILQGGHVIFSIVEDGSKIQCAAYEPTGRFRKIVRKLQEGDQVKVYGGVKPTNGHGLTLNLEKLEVLFLSKSFATKNPSCKACFRSMESMGRSQGFRCRKCKETSPKKVVTAVGRNIKTGLYCVPPRAMRHLSMPIIELKETAREIKPLFLSQ